MTGKTSTGGATQAQIQIRYYRSAIGSPRKHKLIIKSLGFKRLNQVVTRSDTPAVRGMVARIPHLVTILNSDR